MQYCKQMITPIKANDYTDFLFVDLSRLKRDSWHKLFV